MTIAGIQNASGPEEAPNGGTCGLGAPRLRLAEERAVRPCYGEAAGVGGESAPLSVEPEMP